MQPRLNPKAALVHPPTTARAPSSPATATVAERVPVHMDRERNGRPDFVATGLAAVATAMSYLLSVVVVAGGDPGGTPVGAGAAWQVILAFGLMSTGLLMVMYGMRARGALPPPLLVRRVADAAGAALLHAGGPERLVPVVILLLLPFLEAWFDFF